MTSSGPVYIFDIWKREPVFHTAPPWSEAWQHEVSPDGRHETHFRTACGRDINSTTWRELADGRSVEYEHRDRATVMRRDHAEAIGRICARCAAT